MLSGDGLGFWVMVLVAWFLLALLVYSFSLLPSELAGLRGSSLRFPPIEATKPEVPRQLGARKAKRREKRAEPSKVLELGAEK